MVEVDKKKVSKTNKKKKVGVKEKSNPKEKIEKISAKDLKSPAIEKETDLQTLIDDSKEHEVVLITVDGVKRIQCDEDTNIFTASEMSDKIAHQELPVLCRTGQCGACAGRLINGSVD